MAADDQTEQYAEAMDEAITSAVRAEGERDAAQAEVGRLTRKYEPDDGILIDKLLKLTDDHSASFMRVLVRTGEYLLLELVPRVRNNGNVPNMMFRPPIEGKRDNMQEFPRYGVYEVCIGDGTFSHGCVVHFDKAGVRFSDNHEPVMNERPLTIEEFTQPATVTLCNQ